MSMGGHNRVERLIGDDLEKSISVVRSIDDYAATAAVLEQVGIVVDRSNADLGHGHRSGESQNQRRTAGFNMVYAKHQNAGSRRSAAPVTAEASFLPSSPPRRLALLPFTSTASPALPTAVVTPESDLSWSLGNSSRFRSRKAHHSSSQSAVWLSISVIWKPTSRSTWWITTSSSRANGSSRAGACSPRLISTTASQASAASSSSNAELNRPAEVSRSIWRSRPDRPAPASISAARCSGEEYISWRSPVRAH